MQLFVRGTDRTYVLDLAPGATFDHLRAEVSALEACGEDVSLSVGGRPLDGDTDLFSLVEGATVDVCVPLKGGKVSERRPCWFSTSREGQRPNLGDPPPANGRSLCITWCNRNLLTKVQQKVTFV